MCPALRDTFKFTGRAASGALFRQAEIRHRTQRMDGQRLFRLSEITGVGQDRRAISALRRDCQAMPAGGWRGGYGSRVPSDRMAFSLPLPEK